MMVKAQAAKEKIWTSSKSKLLCIKNTYQQSKKLTQNWIRHLQTFI